MAQPRIGFLGLGIMGHPMSRNLLKAGYAVTVWNRSPRPEVEQLRAAGAGVAASPKGAAQNSDVIITIVTDGPDVEQVLFGANGMMEGAREGLIAIDMSTISPQIARSLYERCAAKGVRFLDAPVTGGDVGAINATLSIMVGGDKEVFEQCVPIFEAMGKRITYVGPSGSGQTVKLCNQIIGAMNMLGLCEALVFGKKMGADVERILEVVGAGAASSWAVQNLGPKIIAGDFAPGFMVKLEQKDLRLALDNGRTANVPMPATALVHQLFRVVEADGKGDLGFHALVLALEKLAGVEARKG